MEIDAEAADYAGFSDSGAAEEGGAAVMTTGPIAALKDSNAARDSKGHAAAATSAEMTEEAKSLPEQISRDFSRKQNSKELSGAAAVLILRKDSGASLKDGISTDFSRRQNS